MDCLFLLLVAYLGKHKGALVTRERTLNQGMWWVTIKSFYSAPSQKPDIPKLILFPHSPVPPTEEALLANEVVCRRQGSPLSLTLITSFTNLQIYYSTVREGGSAITSSMVSRPVMTTGPISQFRIRPVGKYRVKTLQYFVSFRKHSLTFS